MMRLHFKHGFDSAQQADAEARGWLGDVIAESHDGRRYPVVFWDAVRLAQDLEAEQQFDRPFIADPGMIVLPLVTMANMQAAVDRLELEHFFDRLLPVS